MNNIPTNIIKLIESSRKELRDKKEISQKYLDDITDTLRPHKHSLMQNEKDEILHIADTKGKPTSLKAPRWACHLLGLRHRCVHILLQWKSPSLSDVFVLQIRSWNKFDQPGHLDMSVSGHVVGDSTAEETAITELSEELGLSIDDLQDSKLKWRTSYENNKEYPEKHFYNVEWCDVFTAKISTSTMENISFSDKEVVGLYLCPSSESKKLLKKHCLPLSSGLQHSLPFFM
jgi:isopentenyl-diphosphate Delta-isomerase